LISAVASTNCNFLLINLFYLQLVQNHERDLETELDGMIINAVEDNGQDEVFELIPYIMDKI
jgi:hypothetical protein